MHIRQLEAAGHSIVPESLGSRSESAISRRVPSQRAPRGRSNCTIRAGWPKDQAVQQCGCLRTGFCSALSWTPAQVRMHSIPQGAIDYDSVPASPVKYLSTMEKVRSTSRPTKTVIRTREKASVNERHGTGTGGGTENNAKLDLK